MGSKKKDRAKARKASAAALKEAVAKAEVRTYVYLAAQSYAPFPSIDRSDLRSIDRPTPSINDTGLHARGGHGAPPCAGGGGPAAGVAPDHDAAAHGCGCFVVRAPHAHAAPL